MKFKSFFQFQRYRPIASAISFSLLNQVISSGTGFLLTVYLARALSPEDFGRFGIALASVFLFGGIGNALFLTQMVVNVPDKSPDDRLPYAGRVLIFILLLCGIFIIVLMSFLFLSNLKFIALLADQRYYFFVTGIASSAYLLNSFFVRHSYVVRMERWVLIMNFGAFFFILLVLGLAFFANTSLNTESGLWIYAVSQLFGALIGAKQAKIPLRGKGMRPRQFLDDFSENWRGGSWALGGVLVTWLQTQAYLYVTALFAGPSGVGQANAARLLIMPFLFGVPAINQILLPRLSDMRAANLVRMQKMVMVYTLTLVTFAVFYIFIVWVSLESLISLVFGSKYPNLEPLIVMWFLVLIGLLARTTASIMLQALKDFRSIMILNSVSALVTITAASSLCFLYGILGALAGTMLGEILLASMLWRKIFKNG
jgi:O-antigen/teichoic acid export membrane protein